MSTEEELAEVTSHIAELEARKKRLSHEIGRLKRAGRQVDEAVVEARELAERVKAMKARLDELCERPTAVPASVTLLQTAAEVVGLRDEWRLLVEGSNAASPFTWWEWIASWYEAHEDIGKVQCFVVRDGPGRLLGIVPMFAASGADGRVRRRQMAMASTHGRAWGAYLEPLSQTGKERLVVREVLHYAEQLGTAGCGMRFLRMATESRFVGALAAEAVEASWFVTARKSTPATVVSLPSDPERVLDCLDSPNLRHRLRKAHRLLERDHPSHRIVCPCSDVDLVDLVRMHGEFNIKRRNRMGLSSNFADARFMSAMQTALQRFSKAGALLVVGVWIGADLVASDFGILSRDCLYLLSSGWSERYARYSISHLAHLSAFREAAARGAREADLLSNAPDWKMLYSRQERLTMDLCLSPTKWQMLANLGFDFATHSRRGLSSTCRRMVSLRRATR